MNIWAMADLHLCLGVPDKSMEIFGPRWLNYIDQMQKQWTAHVAKEDLVLVAGDISWAMRLEQAEKDFAWIEALPGTKVMIRGNHDYWWSSATQVRAALPPSLHVVHNDAFEWNGISIGGARLWDTAEYTWGDEKGEPQPDQEKIYERELGRLERSLAAMVGQTRLAMTHYPPIGLAMRPTRASRLLEKYGVSHCVFGHLHALESEKPYFGAQGGVIYHLTAADYLNFSPRKIL